MRFNEQRLQFVISSPAGPVGRFLNRAGAQIQARARVLATTENHSRSGRFRSSIAFHVKTVGRGLVLDVGSNVPYFKYLEGGAEAHPIPPSSKEALWWVEKSNTAGRPWLVPERPLSSVMHPGNPAFRIIGRSIRMELGSQAGRAG